VLVLQNSPACAVGAPVVTKANVDTAAAVAVTAVESIFIFSFHFQKVTLSGLKPLGI
jgi:hypothetical protein